ncbi:MAG TPA: ComEC/Rec2 family competence protein [Sphingomicrobium sp.]|nr:ComEC/Rec2 family competence protein [Sphingomicrobium sp.]
MQRTSAPNIAGAPVPQHARGYWKGRLSAIREDIERFLERERAQLPPWIAVGFGTGIATWFGLGRQEEWAAFLCLTTGLAIAGFGMGTGRLERALGWFALAMATGCALIWLRAGWVASPRLERPAVVTFEARVERVETLAARESLRLTLRPTDSALPPRVRVNLPQDQANRGLAQGAVVRLRARLMPPPPMALPGSHDFARDFWFRGIGASGRAIGEIELLRSSSPTGISGVRARLDRHIREQLPGSAGTVGTAFATGDQNAISDADADAMRRSGLAHLLSVGGLHITAAVGLAMFLSLKLLALSERLALRFNLVLVAAAAGALAGIGYTVLTGSQVPMLRSCIAALIVLAGIAMGREAISLRMLAVAALVILAVRPEAVVGPSFQLSFAAVGAIIALHSTKWARRMFMRRDEGTAGRVGRGVANLLVTGLVVELAVMPFAMFHFHKAGFYGVLANIVAIPLTTFVILPLEFASLLLDSVGIGAPLWWVTGQSIDFLLWIARTVAASTRMATIGDMPAWSLAAMTFGGLWLGLWTTRPRLLGFVPIATGVLGAALTPQPDLLVSGDGRHLALVEEGVPRLLRDRAGDYVRSLFAEVAAYDGDPLSLTGSRSGRCSRDSCVGRIERDSRTWTVLATKSGQKLDWEILSRTCARADIVVSDRWLPRGCMPRWLKLDRDALAKTGGVAIYLGREPRTETVRERIAGHPWGS